MPQDKLITTLKLWQTKYLSAIGHGIKKYNLVGSGALLKSVQIPKQPSVKLFGTTYQMQITAMPYWEQLNDGRGPTETTGSGELRPALEKWLSYNQVRRKVTAGGGKYSTYEGGSDDAWDDKKISSVAYLMARKIHNKGYKARPFITEARRKVDKPMIKAIKSAAAEQVEFRISEVLTFVNSN